MQLRLLEYFVALAREGHFARAAASCNVSQPTLSAGIVMLESDLGKRLVERDRRFIGLTAEGQAILPWAQQILSGCKALALAARTTRDQLKGELRLGAIPASMPFTGLFAETLMRVYPGVGLSIRSLTSREIERALAAYELDAGLTYLEHEPPAHVVGVPLYGEQMMLVVPEASELAGRDSVRWDEALALPLCLLHQGMQNRRILDAHLAVRGRAVSPRAMADSYVALLAMVQSGGFATIMPDRYAPMVPGWARMLPFEEPMPPSQIGLIVPERTPLSPLALAALTIAERLRSSEER